MQVFPSLSFWMSVTYKVKIMKVKIMLSIKQYRLLTTNKLQTKLEFSIRDSCDAGYSLTSKLSLLIKTYKIE